MPDPFRVGLTRDFLKPDGSLGFGDIGLGALDAAEDIQWGFLAEDATELTGELVRDFDALLVMAPRVTERTLTESEKLKLIARFGVGYDNVDVDACTRNGVLLTITPDGVRRPVAIAAITLLLALSHQLLVKDQLTRDGRWNEKLNHMGQGLSGRTLGVIGLGNIGREILRLVAPMEMRHLGYDPHVQPAAVKEFQVQLVQLDELLRQSDYVVLCCALTDETAHLINADRLMLMKPNAFLINVARGGIVDQRALTQALQDGRIGGAGLDVFEHEPIDPQDPLLRQDNVILSPHAICWTDELFLGTGRAACRSILDVAAGRRPKHVVNSEVLGQPQLRATIVK